MPERDVPRRSDDALVIVLHPGLPGGQIRAAIGDLRVLLDFGLIEATDALGTTFRLTDAGIAYHRAQLRKEKPR